MSLIDRMRAGIREATGLVRSGSLAEATQAIQRALRGVRPGDEADDASGSSALHRQGGTLSTGRLMPDREVARPTQARPVPNAEAEVATPGKPMTPDGVPMTSDRTAMHRHAAGAAAALDSVDEAPKTRFLTGSYTNGAGARNYKLFVPDCYRGQALPLIVMLHGCTQTPDDFAAGTRMNLLAEEKQCFVVYPVQARRDNVAKCWNWFKTGDQQRDRGEPSIIAGITLQIMKIYSVDTRRVYIAGLSAGGAMAAIMAITYPDLYAAAGVHSGLAYAVAHDPASAFAAMKQGAAPGAGRASQRVSGAAADCTAIPLIVFHGDQDTTVHPRNAQALVAQWNAIRMHARSEANLVAAFPPVMIERGQAPGGHTYSRALHHDSGGQVVLELWEVHGAGHAWVGGSSTGSYTDPQGPDATGEMVRFFYQHQRAGAA
jgi:poly(hydroxyalkanoate) depolymerase family esterase